MMPVAVAVVIIIKRVVVVVEVMAMIKRAVEVVMHGNGDYESGGCASEMLEGGRSRVDDERSGSGGGYGVVVELMLVVMLVIKVVRVWGMKLCQ